MALGSAGAHDGEEEPGREETPPREGCPPPAGFVPWPREGGSHVDVAPTAALGAAWPGLSLARVGRGGGRVEAH